MLSIAGQTAGPIGLKYFVDTHMGGRGVSKAKKLELLFSKFCFHFFFTGNAGLLASI